LLLACALALTLLTPQAAWPQAVRRVALVVGNAD
jgi:hypothetical protein